LSFADEERLEALVAQPPGHGGDEVVGLKAGLGEDRHARVADDLEDALLLRVEVVRRGLARGLVLGVDRLAEDRRLASPLGAPSMTMAR
jgi:hypothetical protein